MTAFTTLYRGDNVYYDKFMTDKTAKHNYLGQGIYLTTSVQVAKSYIPKNDTEKKFGIRGELKQVYSRPATKNIPEALESFFLSDFLPAIRVTWPGHPWLSSKKLLSDKKYKNEINKARQIFNDWIEKGGVVAKYKRNGDEIEVIAKDPYLESTGHLSEFQIPTEELNRFVLPCEYFHPSEYIRNRRMFEIAYDNKIRFGLVDLEEERDDFLQMSIRLSEHRAMDFSSMIEDNATKIRSINKNVLKIVRACKKNNIHGLEYSGGMRIGGFGQHRAFNIWNDDWLHEFRVK